MKEPSEIGRSAMALEEYFRSTGPWSKESLNIVNIVLAAARAYEAEKQRADRVVPAEPEREEEDDE